MNEQRSVVRKVAYVCAVAVLLLPLSYLSQPATTTSAGGKLAQFRETHNLSQASLGEIDPAGETMKLATLGMRGVAVNILWQKANELQKKEDWTNLSATLEQITKLQPNFISVWQFEGWNQAYNVAVEFDDYHTRYQWIIKGVNFLKQGTRYNSREPRLLWDIGWFLSNKIGRADERVLYRQMFREDDDFHAADDPNRGRSQRDNWLVGMWWFEKAEKLVDQGVPIKGSSPTGNGKSPLLFYSNRPMCQINYADALEEDGTFGDVARLAWEKAAKGWNDYANRDLLTTYNVVVRLGDQERLAKRSQDTLAELDELAPGLRAKIREERMAKLTSEERALIETPADKRPIDKLADASNIEARIGATPFDVAERVEPKHRLKALQLAKAAVDDQQVAQIIDREREIVNFEYWRERCEMERDEEAVAARKAIHQAEKAFALAHLVEAGKLYDDGLHHWRKVLDAHPKLAQDSITIEELYDMVDRYANFLSKDDKPFPDDFILKDVMRAWQAMNRTAPAKKWVPRIPEALDAPTLPGKAEPAGDEKKPALENKLPADTKPNDKPDENSTEKSPASDTSPEKEKASEPQKAADAKADPKAADPKAPDKGEPAPAKPEGEKPSNPTDAGKSAPVKTTAEKPGA